MQHFIVSCITRIITYDTISEKIGYFYMLVICFAGGPIQRHHCNISSRVFCFAFLPVLKVCFVPSRWCLPVSMWMQHCTPFINHYNNNTYLLKVSVAPWFAISKYLRGDSAILVILHAYRHGASLDTCHMPPRGIGDIDSIQTTAWCPQSGPPSMVIVDP